MRSGILVDAAVMAYAGVNSAALAQWRTTPRQLGRAVAKADQTGLFRV